MKFRIINAEHDDQDFEAGRAFGAEAAEQDMVEGAIRRLSKKTKNVSAFQEGWRRGYEERVQQGQKEAA